MSTNSQNKPVNTWKSTTAGILSVIAGLLAIILALMMFPTTRSYRAVKPWRQMAGGGYVRAVDGHYVNYRRDFCVDA